MSFSREIAFVLLIVYRIPSSCLIGLINLFADFFFSGNLFLFAFTNEYSVALILRKFFKHAILIWWMYIFDNDYGQYTQKA